MYICAYRYVDAVGIIESIGLGESMSEAGWADVWDLYSGVMDHRADELLFLAGFAEDFELGEGLWFADRAKLLDIQPLFDTDWMEVVIARENAVEILI